MQKEYNRYVYEGPVMLFDKCVTDVWKAETVASTKKKARSNLTYQAKKTLNLISGARVTLPRNIKKIVRGDN